MRDSFNIAMLDFVCRVSCRVGKGDDGEGAGTAPIHCMAGALKEAMVSVS